MGFVEAFLIGGSVVATNYWVEQLFSMVLFINLYLVLRSGDSTARIWKVGTAPSGKKTGEEVYLLLPSHHHRFLLLHTFLSLPSLSILLLLSFLPCLRSLFLLSSRDHHHAISLSFLLTFTFYPFLSYTVFIPSLTLPPSILFVFL